MEIDKVELRNFINGQFIDSISKEAIRVYNLELEAKPTSSIIQKMDETSTRENNNILQDNNTRDGASNLKAAAEANAAEEFRKAAAENADAKADLDQENRLQWAPPPPSPPGLGSPSATAKPLRVMFR